MDIFEIAELLTTGDGKPLTAIDYRNSRLDRGRYLPLCSRWRKVHSDQQHDGIPYAVQNRRRADAIIISFGKSWRPARVNERKYLLEGYLAPNTYEVYTRHHRYGDYEKSCWIRPTWYWIIRLAAARRGNRH